MPYALIHGESLVACAAWALGESGVTAVDATVAWESVVEAGEPLVLHDALCPMVPPRFIASCVARALEEDSVVVGVRPVTDTVKALTDGLVGDTVDRSGLLAVTSPLVLPASVLRTLASPPGSDLAGLAGELAAAGHRVITLEAPAEGRRVESPDAVLALEALTRSP